MNRLIAIILAGSTVAFAADTKKKPVADPELPQPLDSTVAQPLLDSSPFTRALNLSDSLTLTGIAYIQGKPVATIFDKNKKTSHVVSEEPNAQGWKLAEANAEISRLQAVLARNNENLGIKCRIVFSDDGTSVVDGLTDVGADDGASVIGQAKRPDGVPLNVVAMLSVLVFVVTYLFF